MRDAHTTWHWKLYRCSPFIMFALAMLGFLASAVWGVLGWLAGGALIFWSQSNYFKHRARMWE